VSSRLRLESLRNIEEINRRRLTAGCQPLTEFRQSRPIRGGSQTFKFWYKSLLRAQASGASNGRDVAASWFEGGPLSARSVRNQWSRTTSEESIQ